MAETRRLGRGIKERRKDIQGRKKVEAALRQGEQRLRLALESGRLGTFDLDLRTGRYVDISDLWRSQFGVPPMAAEFTSDQWLQTLDPADRERVSGVLERALEDRQDYATEYRIQGRDGAVCWISAHGTTLYGAAGEPLRLVGVTQDITGLKEREAQREEALREAEGRADRDPLTGLLNHRAFHKRLREEAARAQREGTHLAVVMLDVDGFGFFNNLYGYEAGDSALRSVAECLQTLCRPYDSAARFGGDEFSLILCGVGPAAAAEFEARLRAGLSSLTFQPKGQEEAIPITVSLGVALVSDAGTGGLEALRAADERLRRAKTGGGSGTEADVVRLSTQSAVEGFSMLDALVTAVDNKDRYTRRHSEGVMRYSLMIARELAMGAEGQRLVAVAALLHDVGKIGVPDAVLRKPGPLTAEEMAAVQRHPQTGAIIVQAVPGLEGILDAVRHHHERWDGAGYPAGLAGEETPLIARLMAVADAFSAMTMDRPYRLGMDRADALDILASGAGTQWDPACVAGFLKAQRPERET